MALQNLRVEDVEESIAYIKKWIGAGDYEGAHLMEDLLYKEVLQAIAKGEVINGRACAKAALKAKKLKFPRWCA